MKYSGRFDPSERIGDRFAEACESDLRLQIITYRFRYGCAAKNIQPVRQSVEFAAQTPPGDGRIDLRRPDISVSQQLADRLDAHALGKGEGRGECVARRMERDAPSDVRMFDDSPQTDVAPAVARQVENPLAAGSRAVTQQDRMRDGEQADIDLGAGFSPFRADPPLIMLFQQVFGPQVAQIDIRKAGEAAENIGVAHELQPGLVQRNAHEFENLLLGEVVAADRFAMQLVVGEEVALHVAAAAGQHQNVFERGHVDPRGVVPQRRPLADPRMEVDDEFPVEFAKGQVFAVVTLFDECRQMGVDTPIFIIRAFRAGDADHAEELVVVLSEKGQQIHSAEVGAEKTGFDRLGRGVALLQKERFIAFLHSEADVRQAVVDAVRNGASAERPPCNGLPKRGGYGKSGRKLNPSAVDRDASHDREFSIAQRRFSLHVKEDSESVSHCGK